MQHLLPCSVLKCSQDTKFLVPKFLVLLLLSFLQSQNNSAMDKVVNKSELMLGSVSSSLGGGVPAAPDPCTDVSPRTVTCHPSPGYSGSEGFPGCHCAQSSDSQADSSGATAAPLTAPPFQGSVSKLHCRSPCLLMFSLGLKSSKTKSL